MTVPVLACTPLVAALLWALALGVDRGPLAPGSVLLIVTGLLGLTTVGMVGVTVTGGRWAHRTLLVAVAAMFLLAVVRPIDLLWGLALVSTLIAAIAVLSPGPHGRAAQASCRHRAASACGPPRPLAGRPPVSTRSLGVGRDVSGGHSSSA